MRCGVVLLMLAVFASHASAQDDVISLERRLQMLRERFQTRQTDEQRLLDLRIRHDMGLPVHGDHYFVLPEDLAAMSGDQATEQLKNEEAEVSSLMDRLESLRTELGLRRKELPRSPDIAPGERWISVPVVGSLPDTTWRSLESPQSRSQAGLEEATGATPGPMDPEVLAVIRGSTNHSAVAGSLYSLAASLLRAARRLREEGRVEEARSLDEKARVRLEFALRELEPLVSVANPTLVDLFHQGKCLEERFNLDTRYTGLKDSRNSKVYAERYEAMRQPFLVIRSRDQSVVDGNQRLGSWAQSADTALRLIQWMNDFGDYKPTIEIDSIQWIRK